VHEDEDEVVIVLHGELAHQLGNRRGTLGSGGLRWMPRSVPHTIASTSSEPCRFVTLATPGGLEELFKAQSEYFASLAPGAAPDPMAMAALPGAARRRVIGSPLGASNRTHRVGNWPHCSETYAVDQACMSLGAEHGQRGAPRGIIARVLFGR
jgi:hypothetical protein